MKKVLYLFPALCGSLFLMILLMVLLGSPVMADETGKCGDNVLYHLGNDGTLSVYTYGEGSGTMNDYDDKPEYPENLSPFYGNQNINRLVIHSGVTRIGRMAFVNCTNLQYIQFSDDLLSIGDWAFMDTGLMNLYLPGSLQTIGNGAFESCTSLKFVYVPDQINLGVAGDVFLYCEGLEQFVVNNTNPNYTVWNSILFNKDMTELIAWPAGKTGPCEIPDTVENIMPYAFICANGLSSVTIPDSVQTIGIMAFERCPSLKEITIPGSVHTIGERAFYECEGLRAVTMEEGVSVLDNACFYGCRGLHGVALPDSVTSIGEYAFGATYVQPPMYLEAIFIPAGVSSIDPKAFENCPELTIYGRKGSPAETAAEAASIPFREGGRCGKSAFWSLDEYGTLRIMGSGAMDDYGPDENKSPWRDSVTIEKVKEVSLQDGITKVGAYAFAECRSMTKLYLNGSELEEIGDGAFNSCQALTEVSLPWSLNRLGMGAFNNCRNLEEIRAYCHETSLGYLPFANCPLLTVYAFTDSSVYIYAKAQNIPVVQMDEMDTADLRLPWNLEEIGEEAFAGNTAEVIYMRYKVKRIGKRAFAGCSNLRQILIPDNVTEIAEDAFAGCPSTMVIYSSPGSAAYAYAKEHGFAMGLISIG